MKKKGVELLMETNQASSKSGLDLNGRPFFTDPDVVAAACKSHNSRSRLSGSNSHLRRRCRGRSDCDGVLVVTVFRLERGGRVTGRMKMVMLLLLLFFSV